MSIQKSTTVAPTRRRQWGAERRTTPLPSVHPKPGDHAVTLARLGIIATILFWFVYVVYTIIRQLLDNGAPSFRFTTEAISYVVVVTFLTFSALMYLLARHGALQRFASHVRVPRAELDRHFTGNDGTMTVLVPSYSEEPDVIRATLWSAALQEYPSLRVVLLLDDPPFPSDLGVAARLERSRAVTAEIQDELAEPASRFTAALFHAELQSHDAPLKFDAARELAGHYEWAARWLASRDIPTVGDAHVDEFLTTQVLGGLAGDLNVTARALRQAWLEGADLDDSRIIELYRRLVWIFSAELVTFERKLYGSLSHDANKAMNLNSYIGLMGGRYRIEKSPNGSILRETDESVPGDLVVPDSEYVLTLDADSILLREYCLRLVYFLEQPENSQVAVTQTPYSAFRGGSTRIERLAGATTDLQHILHQGMSYYGATFWVGANAVIRKRALEDIAEVEMIGGFPITRYVQDRTVIEDTESSIDLGTHGWTLMNYPERLSYSATPPDFGSLIVQRRRWANGGLLIAPKFWHQVRERRARGERVGLAEIALRVNYMTSITWASFGLLFLLAYPYDSRLLSPVVLLAALPYFIAMGMDLRYCGYRFRDIVWIYGFNLILLPVNLAGVFKSIEQAITSKKIPFARTPKVRNRTAAPLLYVVAPYVIVVFSVLTFLRDFQAQNWGNATFAAFNAILGMAAIVAYVGIGNSIVDVWLGMTKWLYVEKKPAKSRATEASGTDSDQPHWSEVLYYGAAPEHAAAHSESLEVSR